MADTGFQFRSEGKEEMFSEKRWRLVALHPIEQAPMGFILGAVTAGGRTRGQGVYHEECSYP